MLDVKFILDNVSELKEALKTRAFSLDVKLIQDLTTQRKNYITRKESISAEKNKIAEIFKDITSEKERDKLKSKSIELDKTITNIKKSLEDTESQLNDYVLGIPNIPLKDVPVGVTSEDNKVIKEWGCKPKDFCDHSDIFNKEKLLDFESGVNLAKSRFTVMKGKVAKLHRALVNFMLTIHSEKNNYLEYNVPYIVNKTSLIGTGQLPKFETDLFNLRDTDLYLIPTAEVPLTNLYRNHIFNHTDLPKKLVSHTPCFRSEAGAYGQDTTGIIRQHQFEKVELVQIANPSDTENALEEITLHAEMILESLSIPYRRVLLCTGDLGFASEKTYDLEAWFPSQNKYREISSCSTFGDFQSRRLNIKFKDKTNKKFFVNTLNGSGLAIGRTLAALIENNYQNKTIHIPNQLHSYTGFKTIEL